MNRPASSIRPMHKGNAGRTRWPGCPVNAALRRKVPRSVPPNDGSSGELGFAERTFLRFVVRTLFLASKPLMKPIVLVNASAGTAAAFAGEDLCVRIER